MGVIDSWGETVRVVVAAVSWLSMLLLVLGGEDEDAIAMGYIKVCGWRVGDYEVGIRTKAESVISSLNLEEVCWI